LSFRNASTDFGLRVSFLAELECRDAIERHLAGIVIEIADSTTPPVLASFTYKTWWPCVCPEQP